jgi:hypothetical protein
MPRQRKRTHTSDDKGPRPGTRRRAAQAESDSPDQQDERNKAKFVGEKGVVAQDLPDARHGMNVVDSPRQMRRNLPQQHGGQIGEHEEAGLAGDRAIGEARRGADENATEITSVPPSVSSWRVQFMMTRYARPAI